MDLSFLYDCFFSRIHYIVSHLTQLFLARVFPQLGHVYI